MTIYPPKPGKPPRHKHEPPVWGVTSFGGVLMAATPNADIGAIWMCEICGAAYIARKYSPLLPGWSRITQWRAHRILLRRGYKTDQS